MEEKGMGSDPRAVSQMGGGISNGLFCGHLTSLVFRVFRMTFILGFPKGKISSSGFYYLELTRNTSRTASHNDHHLLFSKVSFTFYLHL